MLLQKTTFLKLQVKFAQQAAKGLRQQLGITVSELTMSSCQLSHVQAELHVANQHVEKVEEMQMNLQSEGMTLMWLLDEM